MDSSTLLYIGVFFFVLGAGIIGLIWVLVALVRSFSRKGKNSSSEPSGLTVLARLMRDVTNKELVVELDGKTFKSVNELSSAQQHRLGIISTVLAKWLQSPPPVETTAEPDQPVPASMPEPEAQPLAFITPEPADQLAPPVSAVEIEQPIPAPSESTPTVSEWIPAETIAVASMDHYVPPFTQEPEAEVKPVSTQIGDVVSGILNPEPSPAPAIKSIAMQINDILQEKIADTQFESRGISVSDGPDHGVLVTMDGKKFSGVKEVPDEEVRTLIRSAVLEWEKQGKPSSK